MKKLGKIIGIIAILTLLVSSLSLFCLADGTETDTAAQSDTAVPKVGALIRRDDWDGPIKHTSHIWDYTWNGNSLKAVCSFYTCDQTASLSLNRNLLYGTTKKVLYYCSGKEVDTSQFVTSESWDSEYVFTYAPMDDENAGWKIGFPTENGTYKIAVRLPESEDVEDTAGNYGNFSEYICICISDHHILNTQWTADGKKLCNNCQDCGTRLAEISIDEESSVGNACAERHRVPNFIRWYLDDEIEEDVENNYPMFGLVFEGKSKAMKKKYPLQTQIPGVVGVYNVYIATFEGDFTLENVTLKTGAVDYEVKPHLWTYTADEYALHADCSVCGTHAEVCINTSTVYEASRDFQNRDIQDYDVFYETDWSNQEGIEQYSVLFTGKETGSNTLYDRAFSKPVTAGDYDVRLAMLSKEDDPNSAYVSTKEKHFYLADISAAECDVIAYGNTEIAQFPEPEKKNGYYQVGTKDELMWCIYKANTAANIELTNDIVVNPITVDEDGNVYSAKYQIYLWDGFGAPGKPFTGTIRGNGYTIYGLYMPNASNQYSGFIDYGKNCEISDLTIENSVLYGVDAGSLMARCDVTGSGTSRTVSGCQSLNCYISGSSTEGGLISWIVSDKGTELHLEECGSDSIVCGSATRGAGGIVGKAEGIDGLFIQYCRNQGKITASDGMAGGIIGYGNLENADSVLMLWHSFNTGSIKGTSYEGGIAGYLKDYGKNKIYFDNCTNTGYLGTCTNIGGIAGYINSTGIGAYYDNSIAQPSYYINAKVAYKTEKSDISLEDYAQKITKTQISGGFICTQYGHTACSHWEMISGANCTTDGELKLECSVCGKTLEDEIIRAYGHHFTSWGECSTCGLSIEDYEEQLAASEEGMTGTVIGKTPVLILLITGGALVALMVVWLLLKRKRRQKQ